jgi:hypothetical protein
MNISRSWFFGLLVIIKIFGVVFATLIFANFTPLIDSELYLKDFYSVEPALRTRIISHLASFLNNLAGPFFTHFIFALISLSGLIYYCFTCNRRWIVLPLLLLPSSLVWTSIVGKEAIFFGAIGLALVIWSKYALGKLNTLDLILLLLAATTCIALRPHYSAALLWLFLSTFAIKKYGIQARPLLVFLFILAAFVVYFTVWDTLLLRGYGAIDPMARASRFDELGISKNSVDGFQNYKNLISLGFIYGMIGPMPSEIIKRIEFLPFLIEGIIIVFSPLVILIAAKSSNLRSKPEFMKIFCWCLMPTMLILIVMHAPFGLLNPGSATRWRTNFDQVFYFAPLLLLFRMIDNDEKENSALPH